MTWLFWACLVMVVFTYAGYPLWLKVRSRWRARPLRAAPCEPSVSFVIAARNEAAALPGKLRTLEQLDYPRERVEVVVVSDGSTDPTADFLQAESNHRLRAVPLPRPMGKAAALNQGVQVARGEIVVFTDARQWIEPQSLRHLVANFSDPEVGGVSGELLLAEPGRNPSADGVGLYWQLEKRIRQLESDTGSTVGATGAFYAVRRELIPTLPAGTILDDVYIPMHVVRQGFRVVFEPQARAWDAPAPTRREFRRKVRTLTGNYQLVQLAPWLLSAANPLRFEFICHKLLRLLVPFALLGIVLSSILLKGVMYETALLLQLLFYGLAPVAVLRPKWSVLGRPANAALAFLVLNTAAVVALLNFVTGKKEVWVR
jgi:cellulose synthase/poly-beta-1,6-N-acetylglucosamine synthase-like glycosyltransferase